MRKGLATQRRHAQICQKGINHAGRDIPATDTSIDVAAPPVLRRKERSGCHDDSALCDAISYALPSLSDGRIMLLAQGVHAVEDVDRILYGECLASVVDGDGAIYRAGEFIPYLESAGVTPALDRHVLKLALDELDTDPLAELGCNLSPTNLLGLSSWLPIFEQIAARSHLASRLILEVTETVPMANAATANALLSDARRLGCRLAIDDFGTGYATAGRLFGIDVDIVKIDALFVTDLRTRPDGHDSLYHMVGLAACVASVIVVEGIETAEQFAAAKAAGATHVQGYHFSRPSLLCPSQGKRLGGDRRRAYGLVPR